MIYRCKNCDAILEVKAGMYIAKCSHCGTEQTLPTFYDNKIEKMYDRAEQLRKNKEFDAALKIYEEIIKESPEDAEAYWCIVLCEFGIEYVFDKKTGLHIPTINRTQYQSILSNENYKTACRLADSGQCILYENQAKEIEKIQKGILEIVNQEEPYDIFICYKETDESGRRTKDSVIANELYHELTDEGYRVFYARISLEDKVGQEYEPFIFAALQSAKVMIVIGTDATYFDAVWVKNEWARFLTQIDNGEKKQLIPAYKSMDPYDLPAEFHTLQCMDMDDLGFVQDLLHGIGKIIPKTEVAEPESHIQVSSKEDNDVSFLLEKAKVFLQQERYDFVNEFCEDILNQDAHCGQAYFYKLLAEAGCPNIESLLSKMEEAFQSRPSILINHFEEYREKALEFLRKKENILAFHEMEAYFDETYKDSFQYDKELEINDFLSPKSIKLLNHAKDNCDGNLAIEVNRIIDAIDGYEAKRVLKNKELIKEGELSCEENFDQFMLDIEQKQNELTKRYENIYKVACSDLEMNTQYCLTSAIRQFREIIDYKDSEEKMKEAKRKIKELGVEHRLEYYNSQKRKRRCNLFVLALI